MDQRRNVRHRVMSGLPLALLLILLVGCEEKANPEYLSWLAPNQNEADSSACEDLCDTFFRCELVGDERACVAACSSVTVQTFGRCAHALECNEVHDCFRDVAATPTGESRDDITGGFGYSPPDEAPENVDAASAGHSDMAVEESDAVDLDTGMESDVGVTESTPDDMGTQSADAAVEVVPTVDCTRACSKVMECWPPGTSHEPCLSACDVAGSADVNECLVETECIDSTTCYDWSVVEHVDCEQACARIAFCFAGRAQSGSRACVGECLFRGTPQERRCLVTTSCNQIDGCF